MTLTWQALGVIVAIIVHAGFVIWWASRITSKMDNVTTALVRLDSELEKRDKLISAQWVKIDGLNTRLTRVETKVGCHKPTAGG